MRPTITCVPAYGRDYLTRAAVEADLRRDKDFMIADHFNPDDGRYINLSDALRSGPVPILRVRYRRLTQVALIDPMSLAERPTEVPRP